MAISTALLIDPSKYDQMDYVGNQHHILEKAQNDAIKALVALVDGYTPTSGAGSPEGVIDGYGGRLYTDTSIDPPSLWVKTTTLGTLTGWRQLIA